MIKKNFKVTSETGFARYAAGLVSVSRRYSSSMNILYQEKSIDLKNAPDCIIQIMNLGIPTGNTFKIKADGTDEIKAIEAISDHLSVLNTHNEIISNHQD